MYCSRVRCHIMTTIPFEYQAIDELKLSQKPIFSIMFPFLEHKPRKLFYRFAWSVSNGGLALLWSVTTAICEFILLTFCQYFLSWTRQMCGNITICRFNSLRSQFEFLLIKWRFIRIGKHLQFHIRFSSINIKLQTYFKIGNVL